MTEPDGTFMCNRRGCAQKGLRTSAERCPSCHFETIPWRRTLTGAELEAALAAEAGGPVLYAKGRKRKDFLVVTTNALPGFRITRVHGDVMGLTVRARDYFSNLAASLRTVIGGEVAGYTQLLVDSRNEARERMIDEAERLGANAIVGFRFDCNEIGNIMTEIAAYGTAVTVMACSEPSPGSTSDNAPSAPRA